MWRSRSQRADRSGTVAPPCGTFVGALRFFVASAVPIVGIVAIAAIAVLATLATIAPFAPLAPAALAAEAGQIDCPGNLLTNPGFETGFTARGRVAETVANGWRAWYERFPGVDGINYVPDYVPRQRSTEDPLAVLTGLWSQEMATEDSTHTAGIWQRVAIPPGSQVLATGAAYAWATSGEDPLHSEPPGTYSLALGLDPAGGDDPHSATIVWTVPVTTTDAWVPLAVEVPVTGSSVTLFTRGQPLGKLRHNVSRWDAMCLRVLGPIGEPTPTPTRRPWPTRTPGPDVPTPTHTPSPVPDPATLTVLEVRLKLDLVATATAEGAGGSTHQALTLPDLLATRAAVEEPALVEVPAVSGEEEGWATHLRYAVEDHAGLIVLAAAALIGGLVVGLGLGGGSARRGDDGPNDGDRSSDPDRTSDPEAGGDGGGRISDDPQAGESNRDTGDEN